MGKGIEAARAMNDQQQQITAEQRDLAQQIERLIARINRAKPGNARPSPSTFRPGEARRGAARTNCGFRGEHKMKLLFAILLACAAGAAFADASTPQASPVLTFCKDGKLIGIQFIVTAPGVITIPFPFDPCAPTAAAPPTPKPPASKPARSST